MCCLAPESQTTSQNCFDFDVKNNMKKKHIQRQHLYGDRKNKKYVQNIIHIQRFQLRLRICSTTEMQNSEEEWNYTIIIIEPC